MPKNIIFMPHANLQYSQLPPARRAWTIDASYKPIFDAVSRLKTPIGFEASGESMAIIARERPSVLDQLKGLIRDGLVEPVGSPHTHIMLSNIDPEIGLQSLIHGLDTWEKLIGVRPVTGWNPECSWAEFIPEIYRSAGYETLIADADSYLLGSVPGLRQQTGLKYDVCGHSNKNALFAIEKHIADRPDVLRRLFAPQRLANGLTVLLRSDMLCNLLLWYLMGATEGNRAEPVKIEEVRTALARWRDRMPADGGYLMPYAEDAEYVGTTAYFYVKQFGQARFFEPAPESVDRFVELLECANKLGFTFKSPAGYLKGASTIEATGFEAIDNGCAWHGGTARAWTNTSHARIIDPVCRSLFDGLKDCAAALKLDSPWDHDDFKSVLHSIETAYVSDARWPPAPTSPGRFNVTEALDALDQANRKLRELMKRRGLANRVALYSADILQTQIDGIRGELMAFKYFGEK